MSDLALTWVLTYGIHSTLILFTILGISYLLGQKQLRLQNILLRAALITGFLTATVQTVGDLSPIGGSFLLPQSEELSEADTLPASHQIETIQISGTHINGSQFYFQNSNIRNTAVIEPVVEESGFSWTMLFFIGWGLLATLGMLRLLYSFLKIRRISRAKVKDSAVLSSFNAIRKNSGYRPSVTLTVSEQITSPLAISREEICLPQQVLDSMDTHQQRSVLAHEMAHLVRRDPLWFGIIAITETLFFFQPLNYLARQRIRATAEYLCDDWALQQTGRSLDLARCLSNVAHWMKQKSTLPGYVAAMASAGSLKKRVVRILDQDTQRNDGFRYSAPIFAVFLGMLVLTVAPRFATAEIPIAADSFSPPVIQQVYIQQHSQLIINRGSAQQRFIQESVVIIMPLQVENPVSEEKSPQIIWH